MQRRDVLTRGGTSIAAMVALAGCTGGSDDGDGDDNETESSETETDTPADQEDGQSTATGTDTETTTDDGTTESSDGTGDGSDENGDNSSSEFVQEEMGAIGSNDIDELTIVAWESETADGEFSVRVAVENTGDQETDAGRYTYEIIPYDESGSELETTGFAESYPGKTEMAPGGVGSVMVTPAMDADPSAVASYEIDLHCNGPFADGAYCSN